MRRSASEIINDLETRIARLERQAAPRIVDTFVEPADPRVTLRNSIMDNPRSGTVYALENLQRGSHKFYEIIVEGSDVRINFGRIGTRGRTQVKEFYDREEAMDFAEEMYRAKRKKDYIDIFDGMRVPEARGKYSPTGFDPYHWVSDLAKMQGH